MRLKSLSFSSSWRFVGCPAVQSRDPCVPGQYLRRAFYSVQFEVLVSMRVSEIRFYLHFPSSVNLQKLTKIPYTPPPAITTNNRFYIVNISSKIRI